MAKLVQILLIAECLVKIEIVEALTELLNSIGIPNGDVVASAIYKVLESSEVGPALSYYEHDDGQRFLCAALLLIHALGLLQREFYIELMLGYCEGNQSTRY